MTFLSSLFRPLVLLFAATVPAIATPGIAVVRVSEVFNDYHVTISAREAAAVERQSIHLDPRLQALRNLADEMKPLAARLSKNSLEPTAREELMRQYQMKQEEFRALQEDFQAFQESRSKELNARLVRDMEAILDQIRAEAVALGKARGYDWVIDISGNSNTGVPFVLYVKDAPDLSADLLEKLNADAPPELEPTTEGAPPAAE